MPKAAPWAPGQSGNPNGRPPGTGYKQIAAVRRMERASVDGRLTDLAQRLEVGRLMTPLQFFQSIYLDDEEDMGFRLAAATQAASYMHRRLPAALELSGPGGSALDYAQMNQLPPVERSTVLAMLAKMGAKTTAGHVPVAVEPSDIEDATVVNESRPGV